MSDLVAWGEAAKSTALGHQGKREFIGPAPGQDVRLCLGWERVSPDPCDTADVRLDHQKQGRVGSLPGLGFTRKDRDDSHLVSSTEDFRFLKFVSMS